MTQRIIITENEMVLTPGPPSIKVVEAGSIGPRGPVGLAGENGSSQAGSVVVIPDVDGVADVASAISAGATSVIVYPVATTIIMPTASAAEGPEFTLVLPLRGVDHDVLEIGWTITSISSITFVDSNGDPVYAELGSGDASEQTFIWHMVPVDFTPFGWAGFLWVASPTSLEPHTVIWVPDQVVWSDAYDGTGTIYHRLNFDLGNPGGPECPPDWSISATYTPTEFWNTLNGVTLIYTPSTGYGWTVTQMAEPTTVWTYLPGLPPFTGVQGALFANRPNVTRIWPQGNNAPISSQVRAVESTASDITISTEIGTYVLTNGEQTVTLPNAVDMIAEGQEWVIVAKVFNHVISCAEGIFDQNGDEQTSYPIAPNGPDSIRIGIVDDRWRVLDAGVTGASLEAASQIDALNLGSAAQADTGDFDPAGTSASAITALGVGSANGVAELDASGTVPSSQLPSYVDDVIEAADFAALSSVLAASGKIYVTLDDGKTFRWSGSAFVEISASLALGETSGTAYRGDRGKTAYDHSQASGNPHGAAVDDITGLTTALAGKVGTGDASVTNARTPTAHKTSHATGGTDAITPSDIGAVPTSRTINGQALTADLTISTAARVGLAPPVPCAVAMFRRLTNNQSMIRGRIYWLPFPILAVNRKATHIWIDVVTGVASCSATGAIVAAASTTNDAPGAKLTSTSVGGISMTSSSAMTGAALTTPYTLLAGTKYFIAVLALGGSSDPSCRGTDSLMESFMMQAAVSAPVSPTTNSGMVGGFGWSGQTSIVDNPTHYYQYTPINQAPSVWVSLEAP